MKRCSTLLVTRELHTKTTVRYHCTPTRMIKISKSENSVDKGLAQWKGENWCTLWKTGKSNQNGTCAYVMTQLSNSQQIKAHAHQKKNKIPKMTLVHKTGRIELSMSTRIEKSIVAWSQKEYYTTTRTIKVSCFNLDESLKSNIEWKIHIPRSIYQMIP